MIYAEGAVWVQRRDGFERYLGAQNPCAWECEGKRKVKKKKISGLSNLIDGFSNHQIITYRTE